MNAKELIESGKLELYVAGALCGKEARDVATMVKDNPMLQQEVKAIEKAMLAALSEGKAEPGHGVKDKIMSEIRKQPDVSGNGKEVFLSARSSEAKVVSLNSLNNWLAAASVALLLALSFTYYSLNKKISNQQAEIAALNEKYNTRQVNDAKVTEQLALINDQNTKKILLNGVAASPESKVVVYWNSLNGRVIISPINLPAPPEGKQYQLWALEGGKPVDAGVFDLVKDSVKLQEMKNIGNAQAFAITLEQKGGVPSPTLSAMYVIGNI